MAYVNPLKQTSPTANMAMETTLVLGANSFAGRCFVDAALSAGQRVVGVNRSAESGDAFHPHRRNASAANYHFHQLDLNADWDELHALIDETRPHYVVDFAGQGMVAESWQHPEQWYQTNVVAKVKLHDALRRQTALKRYIRVSTPEVYGSTDYAVTEDEDFRPSTPYAVSHAAIDLSLLAFHRQYGFPVVLTRFANFFGPGQQLYRVVPRTILNILNHSKLQLHGGGGSVRAFIYASDVATALMSVIRAGVNGETYHFSPADFITIRQLVERICAKMNAPFSGVVEITADRPGKDQAYLMNSDKARDRLGWAPKIALDAGLDDTIAWVTQHFNEFKNLDWNYQHKP
jgi:dTDP-glucose 4,6-dehydratase